MNEQNTIDQLRDSLTRVMLGSNQRIDKAERRVKFLRAALREFVEITKWDSDPELRLIALRKCALDALKKTVSGRITVPGSRRK